MKLNTFSVAIMSLMLLGLSIIGWGLAFDAMDRDQMDYEHQIEEMNNGGIY